MAKASLFLLLLAVSSRPVSLSKVFTSTPNIEAEEGDTAEFDCFYSPDFTNPRIEWKFRKLDGSESVIYLNGAVTDAYKDRVDFFNPEMILHKVTSKDSGTYVCQVAKTSPPSMSGTALIKLSVQDSKT
ncbi:junctional adhesion molecule A-like [Rhinatrema bivittatum]|uniref:junctional adhesion molecule A-like n=1 Tax=Rhinatrema bivittatum TaxID=194408 RepID=UPI00112E5015|nr:junctional adhesion molecule A-like [Rhinatrema bivittatum]